MLLFFCVCVSQRMHSSPEKSKSVRLIPFVSFTGTTITIPIFFFYFIYCHWLLLSKSTTKNYQNIDSSICCQRIFFSQLLSLLPLPGFLSFHGVGVHFSSVNFHSRNLGQLHFSRRRVGSIKMEFNFAQFGNVHPNQCQPLWYGSRQTLKEVGVLVMISTVLNKFVPSLKWRSRQWFASGL